MEVRADTYLWAIRMYKSRTLASEAIKGGKVKLGGDNFKPSHIVKVGEHYTLTVGDTKKIVEVTALLEKRGNFELAQKHYKDHSPPQTKQEKLDSVFFSTNIKRVKGSGRPTKKDRRDMNDFGSL
ncbi:MAG: RNA-binding S4 domain-containing protein [Bacteroidia bacterium]|nr:RNA-binding S4 domain-containing protein [Bacteroidia bacterium]